MDAYTGFAQVYDMFMDNVPYDSWLPLAFSNISAAEEKSSADATLLEINDS